MAIWTIATLVDEYLKPFGSAIALGASVKAYTFRNGHEFEEALEDIKRVHLHTEDLLTQVK
jgi:hypothetical protein